MRIEFHSRRTKLASIATWLVCTLGSVQGAQPTTPNLKVAFIGDAGNPETGGSARVLELIRDEGAHVVLHQGDLGYDAPVEWMAAIDRILGKDFPYFISVGNHDGPHWTELYGPFLVERLDRLEELLGHPICTGELGGDIEEGGQAIRLSCLFEGLFFILSDIGFWPGSGPGFEDVRAESLRFMETELEASGSIWRVCSWHAADTPLTVAPSVQYGVGSEAYALCAREGAIVATAHSHIYSRTKTLIQTEPPAIHPDWPDGGHVHVGADSTFVIVSGLGGNGIQRQSRCLEDDDDETCDIWASIYDENYGALFIEFHVDGDPRKAAGYFKSVDGETTDSFVVTSSNPENPSEPRFVRGDATGNGALSLSDGMAVLRHLFLGGGQPIACEKAADANDSGHLSLTDAVHVFRWLFAGGTPPAPPSPSGTVYLPRECGVDPTEDDLPCDRTIDACE